MVIGWCGYTNLIMLFVSKNPRGRTSYSSVHGTHRIQSIHQSRPLHRTHQIQPDHPSAHLLGSINERSTHPTNPPDPAINLGSTKWKIQQCCPSTHYLLDPTLRPSICTRDPLKWKINLYTWDWLDPTHLPEHPYGNGPGWKINHPKHLLGPTRSILQVHLKRPTWCNIYPSTHPKDIAHLHGIHIYYTSTHTLCPWGEHQFIQNRI